MECKHYFRINGNCIIYEVIYETKHIFSGKESIEFVEVIQYPMLLNTCPGQQYSDAEISIINKYYPIPKSGKY